MKLREIVNVLNAKVMCAEGEIDNIEIEYAYASDLMSDVLAFCLPGSLLLTGLTNIQIVRTVQMLDLPAIMFVRGKLPLEDTVKLAEQNGIPIIVTPMSMYESCGILFAAKLPACTISPLSEKE